MTLPNSIDYTLIMTIICDDVPIQLIISSTYYLRIILVWLLFWLNGFMWVCIFYLFLWKTSFLYLCVFCVFCFECFESRLSHMCYHFLKNCSVLLFPLQKLTKLFIKILLCKQHASAEVFEFFKKNSFISKCVEQSVEIQDFLDRS